MPAQTIFKKRRGAAAEWVSANPILANGEEGYETDTGFSKIGDGTTAWAALDYQKVSRVAEKVKNSTGSTIAKGAVVYISGATGDEPLVSLADADAELTSSKTLGLSGESIINGANGEIITNGILRGLNTSAATAGDSVWLSSTAGQFVFGAPPAKPAHSVYLGVVVRAHANQGVILVKVQNGYELNELHDVNAGSPSTGDALIWDGTAWVNQQVDVSGAIDIHNSDTTNVHGIADTSLLATKSYADNAAATAAAAIIDSAPTTLDTLNELAAALGDDANFATTMTNALAAKAPLASPIFTGTVTVPDTVEGASASTSTTLFPSATSGNITIGAGQTTGAITIGGGTARSTGAINIGTGAITSGTKTINIGTGTGTGGTSAIVIGSSGGTSTTTFQGTSVTVNSPLYAGTIISTGTNAGNIMNNVGSAGTIDAFAGAGLIHVGRSAATGTLNLLTNAASSGTKAINIGTGSTGGTTAITIGSSSGATSTVALNGTITLPSTTSIGNVSATELGYLDGVTSAIQTQLNSKASTSYVDDEISAIDLSGKQDVVPGVTSTEIAYLQGLQNTVQYQLDNASRQYKSLEFYEALNKSSTSLEIYGPSNGTLFNISSSMYDWEYVSTEPLRYPVEGDRIQIISTSNNDSALIGTWDVISSDNYGNIMISIPGYSGWTNDYITSLVLFKPYIKYSGIIYNKDESKFKAFSNSTTQYVDEALIAEYNLDTNVVELLTPNNPTISNPTFEVITTGTFITAGEEWGYAVNSPAPHSFTAVRTDAYPYAVGSNVILSGTTHDGQSVDGIVFEITYNGFHDIYSLEAIELTPVNSSDYAAVDAWWAITTGGQWGQGNTGNIAPVTTRTITPANIGHLDAPTISNPTFNIISVSGSYSADEIINPSISGSVKLATYSSTAYQALTVGTFIKLVNSTSGTENIDSVVFEVVQNAYDAVFEFYYIGLLAVDSANYSAVDSWVTSVYANGTSGMTFGVLAENAITPTEIGYLDGLTENIQAQLNAASGPSSTSVSSNITLAAGKYFVDTSSARTLTLPASPSLGDEIQIFDASGTAGTNNITIARNSNKINGLTDNAALDADGVAAVLVWTGSTYGWRLG